MSIILENSELFKELIFFKTLSQGSKCYIIEKKDYIEKFAFVSVNYGAGDVSFKTSDGKEVTSPIGTAHFLEHKLFENKNGNAFDDFTKFGSFANAFTDFSKTVYYFSCDSNFYENLKVLLNFVQEPYFEKESVEREKSIIASEINMYEDNPFWTGYYDLLNAMYYNDTVKYKIAGSESSISKITPDTLLENYKNFYVPSNMNIVICGDIDHDEVFSFVEKNILKNDHKKAETIYPNEEKTVKSNFTTSEKNVEKDIFFIGYKLFPDKSLNLPLKEQTIRLLLDYIIGESSELFNRLYDENKIDSDISVTYNRTFNNEYVIITGGSNNAPVVFDEIQKKIDTLKKSGIDREIFERLRKKHKGYFIKSFNSSENICLRELEYISKEYGLSDYYNALIETNLEIGEKLLKEFTNENSSLSVIKKKEGK